MPWRTIRQAGSGMREVVDEGWKLVARSSDLQSTYGHDASGALPIDWDDLPTSQQLSPRPP